MKGKKPTDIVERVKAVQDLMPASDVLRLFNNLVEAGRESALVARDIARINATRDVLLNEISQKYALMHKVFDRIFDERAGAIDKHFQIIEKGLAANDRDLILGGLKGLSDIVASSPFGSIEQLSRMLEGKQPIQI